MKKFMVFVSTVVILLVTTSLFAAIVYVQPYTTNAKKGDALLTGDASGFIGDTLEAAFGGYWSHSGMMSDNGYNIRHNTMDVDQLVLNKNWLGVPTSINATSLMNGLPGLYTQTTTWTAATDVVLKPTVENEAAYRPLLQAIADKELWLAEYYNVHSYVCSSVSDLISRFNNSNTLTSGLGGHCSGTIWYSNYLMGKTMNVFYANTDCVDAGAFALYDGLYALILEKVKEQAGFWGTIGIVNSADVATKIANQVVNAFGRGVWDDTSDKWRSLEGTMITYNVAPDHLVMAGVTNPSGTQAGVQTAASSYYGKIENTIRGGGYFIDDGTGSNVTKSATFGGTGGTAFDDMAGIPSTPVISKIGARTGSRVDQVNITYSNGATFTHGGTGGTAKSLTLNSGEYITKVDLRSGSEVDKIIFYTSAGRTIGGGGTGGKAATVTPPAGYTKIIGFFGRSGSRMDQIGFYIE
jgi:hypothetical protein